MPKYYVKVGEGRTVIDRQSAIEAVAEVVRIHFPALEPGCTATVSEQGFEGSKWTCYKVDHMLKALGED
jgi:hypothetical protein